MIQDSYDNGSVLNENLELKKNFFKYLSFWKYFVYTLIFFLLIAFFYLRYADKSYSTTAKIKIIDKRESSLDLPTASDLVSNFKINLENEIEMFKSQPLVHEVIKNLDLQTNVFAEGKIKNSLIVDYPFEIKLKCLPDILTDEKFKLNILDNGLEIIDLDKNKFTFKGENTNNFNHNLPFEILNFDKEKFKLQGVQGYKIAFSSIKETTRFLKETIEVSQVGKESDIIQLNFKSTNPKYSENILNELINAFNTDGVRDRQLIHQRTIDFVDDRYRFLSLELDSIEIAKQIYKANNELVDLSANSAMSLEQSFKSEESIFSIENQISIIKLLISTLDNSKKDLLPAKLGVENDEINLLISDYNQNIIERKKLVISAGVNNPSVKQIDNIIFDTRSNIVFSLQNFLSQLESLKLKLSNQYSKYNVDVLDLPEQEKILRSIERNQKIKEALYLFLLQKREEAQVSLAVTEPTVKVIEHAITDDISVFPNSKVIYLLAIVLALFVPFIILYFIFYFDNKIYSKQQLDDLKLPISVIGEIPKIIEEDKKLISSSKEKSLIAESFRILVSNLKFITNQQSKKCQVIFITSSIKGEGKTFTALNLSLASASVGKKVLLIGADLHNPQIHNYLNVKKDTSGLSTLLSGDGSSWKKTIIKSNSEIECDFILSGLIPPNPAQLLNNGVFKKILSDAKNYYDYIIVDTPPCLPVSDTLSIIHLSDIILFVMRCNYTKIEITDFLKNSYNKGIIKNNCMIVLNELGSKGKFGYFEGYNYGYDYGYSAD